LQRCCSRAGQITPAGISTIHEAYSGAQRIGDIERILARVALQLARSRDRRALRDACTGSRQEALQLLNPALGNWRPSRTYLTWAELAWNAQVIEKPACVISRRRLIKRLR